MIPHLTPIIFFRAAEISYTMASYTVQLHPAIGTAKIRRIRPIQRVTGTTSPVMVRRDSEFVEAIGYPDYRDLGCDCINIRATYSFDTNVRKEIKINGARAHSVSPETNAAFHI